ncbi:MAG: carboxymuconolactone decarboxylase family protein [Armatimonadetes bacterium]|nr:carboxymuconolactone decarboxylase family protein [Armatimonadota bacterium]
MQQGNDDGQARLELGGFHKLAPGVTDSLRAIGGAVKRSGLDERLVELVKIRASQINGCAFCLQMHATAARKLGETEDRLQLLCVWHEAPVFSARERAALAWTEALTRITEGHVSQEVYDQARTSFSEEELAHLTGAIVTINAWNRIAVAYRFTPEVRPQP